jgi:predicted transcriptional regulator
MQYTGFGFAIGFLLIPLFMLLIIPIDNYDPENKMLTPEWIKRGETSKYIPDTFPTDQNHILHQWILMGVLGNIDLYQVPVRDTLRGYRRITSKNIFEHETRQKIFTLISENPGISLKDLAGLSQCNKSTIRYHLDKISQENYIKRFGEGKYSHFFESRTGFSPDQQQFFSSISSGQSGKIIQKIRESPGLTRKELAESLGVASSTVTRTVLFLAGTGSVILKKEGRITRHYLSEDSMAIILGFYGKNQLPLSVPAVND